MKPRSRTSDLRLLVAHRLRRVLESLHVRRRPFKRPILVFSTRRSGSTLLLEMIASQPRINYSDQPLDLWQYHPYRHRLPQPYLYQFISLAPEEEPMLRELFRDLLSGRITIRSQWNPFDSKYTFIVDRMAAKLLNCKPLMDWFTSEFDADIVYLLRHPIPTALSIQHRGWGCTAEAFLVNEEFCGRFLDAGRIQECRRVLKGGTSLQKHVLEWGLENLVPLSVWAERPWLCLTYEELIARPEPVSNLLAERLALSDPGHMRDCVALPSKTTQAESKADIGAMEPVHLLSRWMRTVDKDDAAEAMQLLESVCRVSVYTSDSPFPTPELCHFGPLVEERMS